MTFKTRFGNPQPMNNIMDHLKLEPRLSKNIGGTFVDAGAAQGEFINLALKLQYHKILAFEPNPLFYGNLFYDGFYHKQFEAVNRVLHSTSGELIDFHTTLKLNAQKSSVVRSPDLKGFKTIKMETVTLDSYNINDLHFYKIDVEGNELEVLKGSKETLTRCDPMIRVEMTEKKQEVYNFLKDLGYHCVGHIIRNDIIPLHEEIEWFDNGWRSGDYRYSRERYDREWSRPDFVDWSYDLNPVWGDFIFTKEK